MNTNRNLYARVVYTHFLSYVVGGEAGTDS